MKSISESILSSTGTGVEENQKQKSLKIAKRIQQIRKAARICDLFGNELKKFDICYFPSCEVLCIIVDLEEDWNWVLVQTVQNGSKFSTNAVDVDPHRLIKLTDEQINKFTK